MKGDYEEAERFYQEGLCSSIKSGNMHRKAIFLINLSQVAYHQGDYEDAETYALEEISIYRDLEFDFFLAASFSLLAGPVCAKGEPERAARLLSASLNFIESRGGTLGGPSDQPTLDLCLRSIKDQLDEATFQTAWEEGKTLSLDEAYTLAIGENN
jgi:hypothetical protein